jgi:hypothetical protein
MSNEDQLERLIECYKNSPFPSFKVTNYFPIYVDLFSHLVGTQCTFIEVGVLNGGSLFMWRSWLGNDARIIGIDLNPEAEKWQEHGFEIYIGDQGDPNFWANTFDKTGKFDALLDDGGHQAFQQIVTLTQALKFGKEKSLIVIEDTLTSYMKSFGRHRNHSFLQYAKDATDLLSVKNRDLFPGEFPAIDNYEVVELFKNVYSVEFFCGIAAFKLNSKALETPRLVWNKQAEKSEKDFRHDGNTISALVDWPDPFTAIQLVVRGD